MQIKEFSAAFGIHSNASRSRICYWEGSFMSDTNMLDLYFWPTPNGWKITILLEELGLPYSLNYVNIGAGEQFEPEFLKISPNNRMPAIVDHEGVDGKPVQVFESGAIMLYLARKHGQFYGESEHERVEVEQWLMWQMGGLGPMAGQAHHFRQYAPEKIQYGIERYTNEVNRLYGVMNRRLADREYLAGFYSIADMACIGWVILYERQGQDLNDFPNLKAWVERMKARAAVRYGIDVGKDRRKQMDLAKDKDAQSVLFGQKAT